MSTLHTLSRLALSTLLLTLLLASCGRGEERSGSGRHDERRRGGDTIAVGEGESSPGIIGEIPAPAGYRRTVEVQGSYGDWLRRLLLLPGPREVLLYNGAPKRNQSAHAAVLAVDVGRTDLQQCADAVIRLRAEYLYAAGRHDDLAFTLTNGQRAEYGRWRAGERPRLTRNTIRWASTAAPDSSRAGFRSWLDFVFTYAGTASLSRELRPVPADSLAIGDVFVLGGYPGHAVVVVDMVRHERTGERLFLLAQSYMPAQQIHVLRNPNDSTISPWYRVEPDAPLETPEWTFERFAPMRW